jgi:type I restriction enzyme R subunit
VIDGDNWLPDADGDGQGDGSSVPAGNTKDPAGVYGDGTGGSAGAAGGTDKPRKYQIGGRVTVAIARERVQYLDANGKLVTESLRDFTRINLAKNTNRWTPLCRPGAAPTASRP